MGITINRVKTTGRIGAFVRPPIVLSASSPTTTLTTPGTYVFRLDTATLPTTTIQVETTPVVLAQTPDNRFIWDQGGPGEHTFTTVGESITRVIEGETYTIIWDGTGSQLFRVIRKVVANTPATPLVWTTASGSLGSVLEREVVTYTVQATGSTPGYTVATGSLPGGTSLDGSTGEISGRTALVSGTAISTFTVRATDSRNTTADRQFSITVQDTDPDWHTVSLLLHCEGPHDSTTITDETGKTLTRGSAVTISTALAKFGTASVRLPGDSNSYLELPNDPSLNLGTGDFTVEAWMYRTGSLATTLVSSRPTDISSNNCFCLATDATGKFYLHSNQTVIISETTNTAGMVMTLDAWHHVALTRQNGVWKVWLNGVLANTGTYANDLTNQPIRIGFDGLRNEAGKPPYIGHMDEVRISRKVRYTSAFTPAAAPHPGTPSIYDPAYPQVSLLMHFDGPDGSTTFTEQKGKTVSRGGAVTISTAQSKFGGASGLFNGSSHLGIPNSPDFSFGSGDFTVEAWVRFASIPGGTLPCFLSQWGSSQSWQFLYIKEGLYGHTANSLLFQYSTNGSNEARWYAPWVPTMNQWYHLAFSRSGTTARWYVDGVQVGLYNVGTTALFNSTSPLTIGTGLGSGNTPNAICYLNGNLDDARITKGIARYTGRTFALPTQAFPDHD